MIAKQALRKTAKGAELTLSKRRLRGDLIEVFKIFRGLDTININDYVATDLTSTIRNNGSRSLASFLLPGLWNSVIKKCFTLWIDRWSLEYRFSQAPNRKQQMVYSYNCHYRVLHTASLFMTEVHFKYGLLVPHCNVPWASLALGKHVLTSCSGLPVDIPTEKRTTHHL